MKHVKCDTARISKPCDKMYLIIGFNRNTKDDEGVWVNQNNQRIDFDYVQESVVASGHTKKELIESTKEYQRLCGITWEQYFSFRFTIYKQIKFTIYENLRFFKSKTIN